MGIRAMPNSCLDLVLRCRDTCCARSSGVGYTVPEVEVETLPKIVFHHHNFFSTSGSPRFTFGFAEDGSD